MLFTKKESQPGGGNAITTGVEFKDYDQARKWMEGFFYLEDDAVRWIEVTDKGRPSIITIYAKDMSIIIQLKQVL